MPRRSGVSGSGKSSDPRPIPTAVPPSRKKGTSLPNCSARALNFGRLRAHPTSAGSANSTAAASLDPPPKPAPMGIRLVSRISIWPVERVASITRRAARTTRLSAMASGSISVMAVFRAGV